MSVEQQAEEVDKVKRSENGVITDPFFLHPDNTLQEANELMGKSEFLVFLSQMMIESLLVLLLTEILNLKKISQDQLRNV